MKVAAAAVVGLLAVATSPAMAVSDEDLQARIAEMKRSMQRSYQEHEEYKAARVAEVRASCAKSGGVSIGMAASQIVKSCWGKPRKVNETITAHGKHEQWVYAGGYLYLDNGTLTSIQTSR